MAKARWNTALKMNQNTSKQKKKWNKTEWEKIEEVKMKIEQVEEGIEEENQVWEWRSSDSNQ